MTRGRAPGGSGFRGFTNFTDWLTRQRERDDTVGAFARSAADDPRWPRRRITLLAFVAYLHERDRIEFSRERLETAWREYEAASDAYAFNPPPRRG